MFLLQRRLSSMRSDALLICLILFLGSFCDAQKKTNYCTVCRVIVKEVEWSISQVDPKKSIQVGSFRVDPKGNQNIKDKQYARSEVHLEELFESVCQRMSYYAELTTEDGTRQMVRTMGFNGETLDTKDLKLDRSKGNALQYQCENFLEDHEEELISLLQRNNIPDYEKLICEVERDVCSEEELSRPFPTLPVAKIEEPVTDEGEIENSDDSEESEIRDQEEDDAASDPNEKLEL